MLGAVQIEVHKAEPIAVSRVRVTAPAWYLVSEPKLELVAFLPFCCNNDKSQIRKLISSSAFQTFLFHRSFICLSLHFLYLLALNISKSSPPLLSTQSTAMNRRKPLRNKNLVCFYCNGKSEQRYDGKIRQWDCRRCDATNYLDEVSCFDHDFQLFLHF